MMLLDSQRFWNNLRERSLTQSSGMAQRCLISLEIGWLAGQPGIKMRTDRRLLLEKVSPRPLPACHVLEVPLPSQHSIEHKELTQK